MALNSHLSKWIDELKSLTQPDTTMLIDGSEEQLETIRIEGMLSGEMIKLN